MKRKFLAWLLTFAMVFNMALPYTAFAEDMVIDTDGSYSVGETDTNNDNDATDEVADDTSTADVPTTDDEQEATADEPAVDEPAADGDNDAESDGKEVNQLAAAVPMMATLGADEPMPVAADELSETISMTGLQALLPETAEGSIDSVSFRNQEAAEGSTPIKGKVEYGKQGNSTVVNITLDREYGFRQSYMAINTTPGINKSPTNSRDLPLISSTTSSNWDHKNNAKEVRTFNLSSSGSSTNNNLYLWYYDTEAKACKYVSLKFNVRLQNNPPTIKADAPTSFTINSGEAFNLDLTTVFEDNEKDEKLKYFVKVNGGSEQKLKDKYNYSYTNTKVGGTYTFVFSAQDAIGESTKEKSPEHTVTVTVLNNTATYDVNVTVPEGVAPTFYYTADAKAGTELTAASSGNVYTVKVPTNITDISWRANGMGAKATVNPESGAANSFELVQSKFVAKADGVVDTAATFTADKNAVGADGTFLLNKNDTYTVTAKPGADNATGYKDTKLTGYAPLAEEKVINLDSKEIKFTYPAGTNLTVSELKANAQGMARTTVEKKSAGSPIWGKVTDTYILENGKTYEYRVTSATATDVTYVGVFTKTAKTPENFVTIAAAQMQDGDNSRNTVNEPKDNMGKGNLAAADVGDLYTNVNARGHVALTTGETDNSFDLLTARSWWASTAGGWSMLPDKYCVEPEYHYTAVDENGRTSDVVEVDANGKITAKKAGTAIVLITYDAMNLTVEQSLYTGSEAPLPNGFYGAIRPENTGVVVVTVDGNSTGIDTGMTINADKKIDQKVEGSKLDADMDVIYFVGDKGSYKFKPQTEGVTVSVANPTITDGVLSFSGYQAVTADDTGSFAVPLTAGRNIVKLEKGGAVAYQIITAKQVNVKVNGTALEDAQVFPGQEVSIEFDTLYNPLKRIFLYNSSAAIIYNDITGYEGKTAGSGRGPYGNYFFSSTKACQTVANFNEETVSDDQYKNPIVALGEKLTVPADFTGESFVLSDGVFNIGGFSSYKVGQWRDVLGTNSTVSGMSGNLNVTLGRLPDISIPVAQLDSIAVTTNPTKMNYAIGESFDPAGMVVTASFSDGNSKPITDYTYTTAPFTTAGGADVTISYTVGGKTKTATVQVSVGETTLEKLEVTTQPTKTMYNVGEEFDPTGMVVKAVYSDESTNAVTNYTYSTAKLTAADTKVSISYGNKSVDVPITMNLVEGIAITTVPNKTEYTAGQSFNPLGMVVTATYTDGNKIPTTQYRYTPTGALTTNDTKVYITYTGADAAAGLPAAEQAITVAAGSGAGSGSGTVKKEITVNVSYIDRGEVVIWAAPVTLSGNTISDAFKAFHKEYCSAGEGGYEEISNESVTGWVTKFWDNDDNSTFSYTYNNGWVYSTEQKIKNGDTITAYNGLDANDYTDLYTYFDKNIYTANTGVAKTLTVNGMNIMNSGAGNKYTGIPYGASVIVFDPVTGKEFDDLATSVNEKGEFTITFTEPGEYTVEVRGTCDYKSYSNAPVVPSRCTVSVSGKSTGGGGSSATTKEDEKTEQKPTVSTTVTPEVKADKNGEAKADIKADTIKNAISDAKTDKADEIVIAPKVDGEASKVTVTIPAASANAVAKDANADLKVKTDIADIKISSNDLKKLGASGNLTVSAEKKSDGTVDVKVTANGKDVILSKGSVTVEKKSAAANDVLVIVKADGTEEVIKKSVTDKDGITAVIDGSCTVKVVSKDVDFADTNAHWSKEAAEFVAAREIFNGTGAKTFAPNDKMDRQMVATVLWRLENEVKGTSANKFNDEVAGWAKEAVVWAADKQIVNGDENGNFNGNQSVSRQELAAMLYRYAKSVGMDTTASGSLSKFTDNSKVADWATDAMKWAVGSGLMKGNEDGTINPNGTATRAEVATVVMRLVEKSVR